MIALQTLQLLTPPAPPSSWSPIVTFPLDELTGDPEIDLPRMIAAAEENVQAMPLSEMFRARHPLLTG